MPYMYIPRIMDKFRATSSADYGLVIIDLYHAGVLKWYGGNRAITPGKD